MNSCQLKETIELEIKTWCPIFKINSSKDQVDLSGGASRIIGSC